MAAANVDKEIDLSKFIFKVTHDKDNVVYGSHDHMIIYEPEDQPADGQTRVATVVAPFGCVVVNHTRTLDNFGSITIFDPFSENPFSLQNKIISI